MVSLKRLEKSGLTDASIKEAFTTENPSAEIIALKNRIRARNTDGLNSNFQTYKIYWAIDQAINAPFKQCTMTLVQALASEPPNSKTILDAVKQFNLEEFYQDEIDPKTNKSTGKKKMRVPTFFNITIPLVSAYLDSTAAHITNERNQSPHFKFEPLVNTPINRARGELLTNRIETMTTQMGMREAARQSILKTLQYGVCLQFIKEEWYKERQENEEGKAAITKEGLRYHLPHPTRMFWDIAHPLSSFFTDTGCEFAGYWRVTRYKDILADKKLWNIDTMRFPTTDLRTQNVSFFNTVYSSCQIVFPQATDMWNSISGDAETKLQNSFYTSDFNDSAVVVSEYFEKLIPKDNGLGTYEYPVWFRFLVANSDTILYASPLPSCPVIYWGYKPDESRAMIPSLALRLLPFQDHASNLFTQSILSTKQNLANAVLVDEDVLTEEDITAIENRGEGFYRVLNFIRVSSKALRRKLNRDSSNAMDDCVKSIRFPQLSEQSTIAVMRELLNLLERVEGISAQEAGGQATHEQSREEVIRTGNATDSRREYTSSYMDRSYDSWKQQLYNYWMAYGEDTITTHITPNPAYTKELFDDLKAEVQSQQNPHTGMKSLAKVRKEKLQLEYFASTRDGKDRTNEPAMAQAMNQFLSSILANPMMQQAIGPAQAIQLTNEVLEQFGFPKDFKLTMAPGGSQTEQQQWVLQQLQTLAQQLTQAFQQGLAQNQQAIMAQVTQMAQAIMSKVNQTIAQTVAPVAQEAREALQKGAIALAGVTKLTQVALHHDDLHEMAAPNAQNPQITLSANGRGQGSPLVVPAGSGVVPQGP
jgi:hypothetical protein